MGARLAKTWGITIGTMIGALISPSELSAGIVAGSLGTWLYVCARLP